MHANVNECMLHCTSTHNETTLHHEFMVYTLSAAVHSLVFGSPLRSPAVHSLVLWVTPKYVAECVAINLW